MKHWELITDERTEGFDIRGYVSPCEDSPEDFCDPQEIADIRDGTLAWFDVKVIASRNGVELATDYLGACCYQDVREFFAEQNGHYADMRANAIKDASAVIAGLSLPDYLA